jgi:cystathionine beta-lyase
LDTVREEFAENRALLRRLLDAHLPEVRWAAPQATYLAWLDVTGLGLGSRPAHTLVSSARVALGEGTNYGPAGAGHVRLNLATSPAIITEAVERISAAIAR